MRELSAEEIELVDTTVHGGKQASRPFSAGERNASTPFCPAPTQSLS